VLYEYSIVYFQLDFDFTREFFAQPFHLGYIVSLIYLNITSFAGIYAHMMRHTSDYGSCGQGKVLILRQLDVVVVLEVVHSLVVTEMEPNFSNLANRTLKMELIWQHSGRFCI